MESEDLFVETPDYAEELEAMDEPENFEEAYDNDADENDVDKELVDKTNAANLNGDTTAPKSNEPRLSSLPLSRIKALMKLDPDFGLVSSEAVFLVTKATELFIDSLAKESFVHTAQAKKKTIQKRDVDQAIESVDALMFLEGTIET